MNCRAVKYILVAKEGKPVEVPQVCGSTHQVGFVIFFDPENPSNLELVGICKNCSDQNIFKELMYEYQTLSRTKDNLYYRLRTDRMIARKNEVHYTDLITPKIDSIKARMKQIRWHNCRYESCNVELDNIRGKIYSATHFSERGKVRQIYYFCSRKHWNIIRARCGLKTITPTLEQFTGN